MHWSAKGVPGIVKKLVRREKNVDWANTALWYFVSICWGVISEWISR